jgi:glucosamine--fructose-6-phosphate aminotransferase (isomerizing)
MNNHGVDPQSMTKLPTKMAAEISEAPDAVGRQAESLRQPLAELVARLKRVPPSIVVTVARGSSAHAATFAKHLIERRFGIPVAAAAPNIATVYRRDLRLDGQVLLAISQSGGSDDLIEQARSVKRSGALVVALTNTSDSPLARESDVVLLMDAGREESVAATKTFVASLSALLRLVAAWNAEPALDQAIGRLPERLERAARLDWSAASTALARASSLVSIGRGPTLAIAREAALKLKETSDLHAEAFSGAEFLHGPVALVSGRYPILMFTPSDEAGPGLRVLARDLRAKGAALFAVDPEEPSESSLLALTPDHPEADALCMIESFYAMAVRLAQLRGKDVDHPRHLKKVTRTR